MSEIVSVPKKTSPRPKPQGSLPWTLLHASDVAPAERDLQLRAAAVTRDLHGNLVARPLLVQCLKQVALQAHRPPVDAHNDVAQDDTPGLIAARLNSVCQQAQPCRS